jgi:hypothetical protein
MPRTHRLFALFAVLVTVFVLGASVASAESSVGIRAGLSSHPDQFLIGAHFQPPPVATNLYIVPSGEAGFGDNLFTLSFNGDLEYQFGSQGSVRPYAGGGLSLYYVNVDNGGSDTNLGVSALGGLLFDRKSGWPIFLELKLGLSDEVPDLKVVAGLMFR